GWYFGFSGFGQKLNDAKGPVSQATFTTTPGTPGNPGDPGSSCIIPTGPFNVGPPGSCVLGPGTPGTPGSGGTPPGTTQGPFAKGTNKFTFKTGYGAGFTLGYMFDGGFRPELAVTYATTDIETATITIGSGAPTTSKPDNASMDAVNVMANGWFDI